MKNIHWTTIPKLNWKNVFLGVLLMGIFAAGWTGRMTWEIASPIMVLCIPFLFAGKKKAE